MEEMNEKDILEMIDDILEVLQQVKPNDRSIIDRYYAITITDMEKVMAYFNTFVVMKIDK